MNWNAIIGVTATFSLLMPVATIIYHRLYKHRSLAALMTSYFLTALYILMALQFLPMPAGFIQFFGTLNNFLDTPLMLISLLFFCPIRQKQRVIHILTAAFVLYEFAILFMFGFGRESVVYISGPGVLLIVFYSLYLFSRQIKVTIHHGKNIGRTLMLASILFCYGCYLLVYFFYYIQKTSFVKDVFILYFIASIASGIVMTVGLNLTRRRLKELQEVQNTRKELALFFKN